VSRESDEWNFMQNLLCGTDAEVDEAADTLKHHQENDMNLITRRSGNLKICPKTCSECPSTFSHSDRTPLHHHWLMQSTLEDEDYEDIAKIIGEDPGLIFTCKHCDAWLEAQCYDDGDWPNLEQDLWRTTIEYHAKQAGKSCKRVDAPDDSSLVDDKQECQHCHGVRIIICMCAGDTCACSNDGHYECPYC